jgi:hypothetical protein
MAVNPQSLSIASIPGGILGGNASGGSPVSASAPPANIYNLLQYMSQLYGSGPATGGLGVGALGQNRPTAPISAIPGATSAAQATIPSWIQSQLQTGSNAGSPVSQMATLYPTYTPDQTNMALAGQLYGTLGSNNLPWTS